MLLADVVTSLPWRVVAVSCGVWEPSMLAKE